ESSADQSQPPVIDHQGGKGKTQHDHLDQRYQHLHRDIALRSLLKGQCAVCHVREQPGKKPADSPFSEYVECSRGRSARDRIKNGQAYQGEVGVQRFETMRSENVIGGVTAEPDHEADQQRIHGRSREQCGFHDTGETSSCCSPRCNALRAASVRSISLSIPNRSTIRDLAFSARALSSAVNFWRIRSMASHSAAVFFGGTDKPESPVMAAESPTSVTTHGRPHAMASAMTFENPSPYEVDTAISRALYTAAMASCGPAQTSRSFNPRRSACDLAACTRSGLPPPTQTNRQQGSRAANNAAVCRNVG